MGSAYAIGWRVTVDDGCPTAFDNTNVAGEIRRLEVSLDETTDVWEIDFDAVFMNEIPSHCQSIVHTCGLYNYGYY